MGMMERDEREIRFWTLDLGRGRSVGISPVGRVWAGS